MHFVTFQSTIIAAQLVKHIHFALHLTGQRMNPLYLHFGVGEYEIYMKQGDERNMQERVDLQLSKNLQLQA